MNTFLQLIGWRETPGQTKLGLFRTWHSYAALAIAVVVIAGIGKLT